MNIKTMFFPDDLIERYEVLRALIMNRAVSITSGWGLALLQEKGLHAWMEACSYNVSASFVECRASKAHLPPATLSAEVTLILAEMMIRNLTGRKVKS